MARARNIKPGFFTNDALAEVPALGRILFQGLWCHADREGRLEDRPRKLKAEILPYDDCDIETLLNALASRGFILRYQVGESRYIQVVKFTKHQNPHIKEPASSIPAPDEHQTSPVQAAESPEQAGLIPDSLNLIPDSKLSPPSGGEVRSVASTPDCPQQTIVDAYHEILPMLPRMRIWDDECQKFLRTRWREDPKRQTIDWWRQYFTYIRDRCPWLTGQVESRDGRAFYADLEWLVRPKNFRKVVRGNYEKKEAA